jgi:hypothetical protein
VGRVEMTEPDKYEIEVFDTCKECPDGFTRVSLHMSSILYKGDKVPPYERDFYRPKVTINASVKNDFMENGYIFGLRDVDAVMVHMGNGDIVSLEGATTIILEGHIKRIVGKVSKFNSTSRDFNTGRIVIYR